MKQLNLCKRYVILSLTLLLTFTLHAQMHVQVTPECDLEITNGRYIIYFHLPNYTLEDVERGDCGEYSSISIPNSEYDMTDEPGYPLLPFYPIHLILPDDVNNVQFSVAAMTTDEEHLSYPLESALMGLGYGIEDCYNEYYYQNGYDSDYPTGFYKDFYTISPVYTQLGSKGVTLSIYPFAYSPEDDYMEVLQEAIFYIDFSEGDIFTTIETVRTSADITSELIMSFFDTFAQVEHNSTIVSNGNYLILAAHHDMDDVLSSYLDYKRDQHYNTEVLYLDTEGVLGNASAIDSLITNNSVMPDPDYVLLVGTLEDIPPFGTTMEYSPYNDDCYYHIVGRWILKTSENVYPYSTIQRIIIKTVRSEYEYNYSNSSAVLFSGIDPYDSSVSDYLFADIVCLQALYLMSIPIPATLYDGRGFISPSDAVDAMTVALQDHPRFFIYRGHGSHDEWDSGIGDPYDLSAEELSVLDNDEPYPIGFGFACGLNTYETNNNFGARWIAESTGGVAFYGATINSYRTENSFLAREIFRILKRQVGNEFFVTLGNWLYVAEQRYLSARLSITRLHQIQKYNLIGDPTLAVFGMFPDGSISPFHKRGVYDEGLAQNLMEENREVIAIDVFDIHGNKMCSLQQMTNVNKLDLESGIYFLRKTYNDGSWSVNKFIK